MWRISSMVISSLQGLESRVLYGEEGHHAGGFRTTWGHVDGRPGASRGDDLKNDGIVRSSMGTTMFNTVGQGKGG